MCLNNILHNFISEIPLNEFSLITFFEEDRNKVKIFDHSKKGWVQHYWLMKYYLIDPVFSDIGKITPPFYWNEKTFKILSHYQKDYFSDAKSFGIIEGITIPLFPTPLYHAFVNIFNKKKLSPRVINDITLVCQQYLVSYYSREGNVLTKREKEVLKFLSQGFHIKEISSRLNLSFSTVAFHANNAKKKLGARSLPHALSLHAGYGWLKKPTF